MFVVIRHTYIITKDHPNDVKSDEYTGTWKHYAFVCRSNAEAMAVAVHMLEEPMLKVNDLIRENAIEQLKENGYYQVGGESISIAECVNPSDLNIDEELEEELNAAEEEASQEH